MELRHLKYFIAVAEEMHFGRAAERLHISQPPLSRQIRQLEMELGFDLFVREGHRIALTEAGSTFLDRARVILETVDRTVGEAERLARGEQGRLAFGFMSAAMLPLLTPTLRTFRERSGGVVLDMVQLPPKEQLEAVANGLLDIGFVDVPGVSRTVRVIDAELMVHALRTDRIVAALPLGHRFAGRRRLRLADLAQEGFVTLGRAPATGFYDEVIGMCHRAGFRPKIVQEVPQVPLMLALVAAGAGVSLVPKGIDKGWLDQIAFRNIDIDGSVDVSMVWRRDNRSPALSAFLRSVIA